ncbi:MAG TPA: hypothetical protein EYN91_04355 [Candidatus Melainabacteria bacterium]|jgi:hypothetical protein|nr:hypothetical protein [Candidatus Melainabacteria bacterium]HIN66174.1 hypothetical protein [Candidatus Obscuribacterales bacterium]
MTTTSVNIRVPEHTCHAIACGKPVTPKVLMCRKHWGMVPKDLQIGVWQTYRPGQEKTKVVTREYMEARRKAIVAVAEKENIEIPRIYATPI